MAVVLNVIVAVYFALAIFSQVVTAWRHFQSVGEVTTTVIVSIGLNCYTVVVVAALWRLGLWH